MDFLRRRRHPGVLALLLLCGGCGLSKQASLESIARDWCMTIRASQVIPVYPLTADLQPGDVFLVQTTIDRQQEIYRRRGFLPLDNHLARLHPTGYTDFYDHSFMASGAAPSTVLPADWIRPKDGAKPWAEAPSAAFPSYAFRIDHGAGFHLAVPVKGIPVGLALLGARSAWGSVSIQRASVLGVDILSLYADLEAWAAEHTGFLRAYAPSEGRRNYLRVVTRVYATGQVAIGLSDAGEVSGGVDAGAPPPLELLVTAPPPSPPGADEASVESYRRAIGAMNALLAETAAGAPGAPGGSLRIAAASSRFIALEETFDPPLVIGYLGFDCEILPGGRIGPPIPTHAVVDPESQGEPFRAETLVASLYGQGAPRETYERLADAAAGSPEARAAVSRLDALARHVPPTMTVYETDDDGALVEREEVFSGAGYLSFMRWLGAVESNAGTLEAHLDESAIVLRRDGEASTLRRGDAGWRRLEEALDAARATLADRAIAAEHRDAAARAGREDLRILSRPGEAP